VTEKLVHHQQQVEFNKKIFFSAYYLSFAISPQIRERDAIFVVQLLTEERGSLTNPSDKSFEARAFTVFLSTSADNQQDSQ
jgi:hypothetical protein